MLKAGAKTALALLLAAFVLIPALQARNSGPADRSNGQTNTNNGKPNTHSSIFYEAPTPELWQPRIDTQTYYFDTYTSADKAPSGFLGFPWDGWVALFTAVLAAVSIWQGYQIRRGERLNVAALKSSQRQARAARKSADAAIAMELPVLRAIPPDDLMSVEQPPPEVGPYGGIPHNMVPTRYSVFADLKFDNHGRTHAYPMKIHVGWCIAQELPEVPVFQRAIDSPRDSIVLAGKGAEVGTKIICVEATPDQIVQFAAGQSFIWLFGKLEYSDFMGTAREIWFFWRWSKVEGEENFYRFQRPVVVPAAYAVQKR